MYKKEIEIIWADLDPNRHMRHTAYSDYATHARISFFIEQGFPPKVLEDLNVGPVLLQESTTYWRELNLNEKAHVTVELAKATEDYSHYTIHQNFYKANGKKSARVIIDGAWMDLEARKLISPPSEVIKSVMDIMPRARKFEVTNPRSFVFI